MSNGDAEWGQRAQRLVQALWLPMVDLGYLHRLRALVQRTKITKPYSYGARVRLLQCC